MICVEEPSISLQNVKKPAFLRSYRIAACSLTKNKTLFTGVFLQAAIRLVVPYGETRYKVAGFLYFLDQSLKTDRHC